MIKRILWAFVALVGGRLIGRPLSGKWLFHYFLGGGREMRLPEAAEVALARAYALRRRRGVLDHYRGYSLEAKHLQQDADLEWYEVCAPGKDLYTTVGSVVMWEEDGYIHYLDVYDWHPDAGWSFDVGGRLFPRVTITGSDDIWLDVADGKPFVTRGRVKDNPGLGALTEDQLDCVKQAEFAFSSRFLDLERLTNKQVRLMYRNLRNPAADTLPFSARWGFL